MVNVDCKVLFVPVGISCGYYLIYRLQCFEKLFASTRLKVHHRIWYKATG
jgi:hypothetical protein